MTAGDRTGSPRDPRTGYAAALAAAAFFGGNGTVSKIALGSELDPARLTALRSLGAFVLLGALLLVIRPRSLRLTWREVPFLLGYGVVGVAMTQWLYFVAIGRLPVGIALLFEYTAPLMVALWARLVWREPVRRRVWGALALSMSGLALVADVVGGGGDLDPVGVIAALGAGAALAVYFLMGERGAARRDPYSLTCWSLGAGALLWSVAQPWESFDAGVLREEVDGRGPLAGTGVPLWVLVGWVVVLGTIVPFSLSVLSLRHLPATVVGIVAMAEPVLAGAAAWLWLGERLAPVQLVGSAVVIGGILIAQTARPGPRATQPEPAPSAELVA